jgi:hypothetical protein
LTDNTGTAVITPEKINKFLKRYLNISVPMEFSFPMTDAANLTIGLENLTISGLNTWTGWNFFVASGDSTLSVCKAGQAEKGP